MGYILDTHTFLWFINGDKQLSKRAKDAIKNAEVSKSISMASFWEIAIKLNIGKLALDMPFSELRDHVTSNGFQLLPITFERLAVLCKLEAQHSDPFDRIIIAQTIAEGQIVITKDKHFKEYSKLQLLW